MINVNISHLRTGANHHNVARCQAEGCKGSVRYLNSDLCIPCYAENRKAQVDRKVGRASSARAKKRWKK